MLGEAELILRIWEAKEKHFQGAEEFSLRDLGRSMHYFKGSREHRPPLGASKDNKSKATSSLFLVKMIAKLERT